MTVADYFKEELLILGRSGALDIDKRKLDEAFPSSMSAKQIEAVLESKLAKFKDAASKNLMSQQDFERELSKSKIVADAFSRAVEKDKNDRLMMTVAVCALGGLVLFLVMRK